MIKKITSYITRLFEKDFSIKIASIIAAVVIWFAVSISVYPVMSKPLNNIPVEINIEGTFAEANDLRVIFQSREFVGITITGQRGQIGNLNASELVAVARADNVRTPGSYSLRLEIECKTGRQFDVIEFNDSLVTVIFDEIITKEFEIKPQIDSGGVSVSLTTGLMVDPDDISVSPETVAVTGPKSMVDRVTEARIRVAVDQDISQTYEYVSSDLSLYSGTLPIIDTENLTFSRTQFNVYIPVMHRQTLEPVVRVTNAPDSFNTEAFIEKLVFSDSALEVAAPSEFVKPTISTIDIGEINMREVDIGTVFTFNADDFLPAGYQTLDGVRTVTVTCPSEGLSKIERHIPGWSIQFVNAQPQYEYNMISSGFMLFFMGPNDVINQLTESDITATIDILKNPFDMTVGDYKPIVEFSIPAHDNVWYTSSDGSPSPKATVNVTLREE
ncbi:MAG: hypothetical protein FWG90_07410 [Oscillospiraceae bacterium]|nr:hypothetical protein [Oscillospiraceae bacterium]